MGRYYTSPPLQPDCHLLNLAGERERHLVVFADGCYGILANVEHFVGRHAVVDGLRVYYCTSLFAVHPERGESIVRESEHLMWPRGEAGIFRKRFLWWGRSP